MTLSEFAAAALTGLLAAQANQEAKIVEVRDHMLVNRAWKIARLMEKMEPKDGKDE